jgi:hypothetical protein
LVHGDPSYFSQTMLNNQFFLLRSGIDMKQI